MGSRSLPPTIEAAGQLLRRRETTSVELTTIALERADEVDDRVGAYITRFDDTALAAARHADAELAQGVDRGPLHGIPVGVKDLLTAAEGPTTAQSIVLDPEWGGRRDATVVVRLRAAGAVITGKLSLSEFAIGRPDASKPFPIPRNPWDVGTWPGGSSSGSGAAVAAGMVLAAIGTDTGGSIRIPAALCGVSGLKPTYGRVPTTGCVPLGYSLDHIGPLAPSAACCAAVLGAIAGHAGSDPASLHAPVPALADARRSRLDGVRIGVDPLAIGADGADAAVAGVFEAAVAVLRSLGAQVEPVTLPAYDEMRAANLLIIGAEAFAFHRPWMQARWQDYNDATRQLIGTGALVPAADYVQAQRLRSLVQARLRDLFTRVDLVVTPTTTVAAPRYVGSSDLDVGPLMNHIHTGYWNCAGNPVLAVPMGCNAAGLPLSLQIAGRSLDEALVLAAGDAYQRVTEWHLRRAEVADVVPVGAAPGVPPAPSADPADRATVAALLAAAGIAPSAAELDAFAAAYRRHVDGVERIHATTVDAGGPALRFTA